MRFAAVAPEDRPGNATSWALEAPELNMHQRMDDASLGHARIVIGCRERVFQRRGEREVSGGNATFFCGPS